MDRDEFCIAMFLIYAKLKGKINEIPATLPASLLPKSTSSQVPQAQVLPSQPSSPAPSVSVNSALTLNQIIAKVNYIRHLFNISNIFYPFVDSCRWTFKNYSNF